jgi:hypothetical protein
MVEEEIRKESVSKKVSIATEGARIDDVCTDDENDELEYEAWKIRELKRVKRDKEEKEQLEKDGNEIDRLRNMTEDQRRQELRNRPKQITNKAIKGKYKFLQKYFHRGAFYLVRNYFLSEIFTFGLNCFNANTCFIIVFRMMRMTFTRGTSREQHSKITSTSPCCQRSCRSRTLAALAAPNTLILWTKIQQLLTVRGHKRINLVWVLSNPPLLLVVQVAIKQTVQ